MHRLANTVMNDGLYSIMARGSDAITHPDTQLYVLSPVDLHAFIQQTDLLKVQPVHHKATNQGRAPGGSEGTEMDNQFSITYLYVLILARQSAHSLYSESTVNGGGERKPTANRT